MFTEILNQIYNSLIHSYLYTIIWGFADNLYKLQVIQNWALKSVFSLTYLFLTIDLYYIIHSFASFSK